jgi:cytochrome oxidase Cu insertion factor (SCO1/SenC/PrrC family)
MGNIKAQTVGAEYRTFRIMRGTIDPKREKMPVLIKYSLMKSINSFMHNLTGTKAKMVAAAGQCEQIVISRLHTMIGLISFD